MSDRETDYDVIVVGGGPSGATAAHEIALAGHKVLLLERAFRIKPCGGAIPPCILGEFDIPRSLLKAEIQSARMISPKAQKVDMPIEGTFVGMVDRDEFDPWLRLRAQRAGADLELAAFKKVEYIDKSTLRVTYVSKDYETETRTATARCVLGADGARSQVAKQVFRSTLMCPGYWPTTRLSKHPNQQLRTMTPSAVRFGTREAYHPISMPGCSPMESRQVLVLAAPTRTSPRRSPLTSCEPSQASIRRKPFGKKVRQYP